MRTIIVGPHERAIVDDDDFERLHVYSWCVAHMPGGYYAVRSVNRKRVYMHHDIIGKPVYGFVTDHINRNSLDNRRENLRHVTYRENRMNSSAVLNATYISFEKNKWRARYPIDGRKVTVGSFNTKEEALQAIAEFKNGL